MIATEIFDRAVPRMRLVKQLLKGNLDGTPGTRRAKRINIGTSWLAAICAVLAWSAHSLALGLAAVAGVGVLVVNNASQLAFFARERGVGFLALSVPLDFLYYLIAGIGVVFGWIARQAVGEPTPGATAEAFVEMGVKRWPPVPVKRVASRTIASELPNTTPSSALPDLSLLSHETNSQLPTDRSRPIE
jgi:hypothetical protein